MATNHVFQITSSSDSDPETSHIPTIPFGTKGVAMLPTAGENRPTETKYSTFSFIVPVERFLDIELRKARQSVPPRLEPPPALKTLNWMHGLWGLVLGVSALTLVLLLSASNAPRIARGSAGNRELWQASAPSAPAAQRDQAVQASASRAVLSVPEAVPGAQTVEINAAPDASAQRRFPSARATARASKKESVLSSVLAPPPA